MSLARNFARKINRRLVGKDNILRADLVKLIEFLTKEAGFIYDETWIWKDDKTDSHVWSVFCSDGSAIFIEFKDQYRDYPLIDVRAFYCKIGYSVYEKHIKV